MTSAIGSARLNRLALGLTTALAILGCSGLMGYGNELGTAQIKPGKAFTASFTASSEPGASHKVWLEYEVAHTKAYAVTGTFELIRGGKSAKVWTLDLGSEGTPVRGETGRISLNKRQTSMNGKGNMSETVKLAALPDLKPGEKAKIVGTFTEGSGTTLKSARLIVTD